MKATTVGAMVAAAVVMAGCGGGSTAKTASAPATTAPKAVKAALAADIQQVYSDVSTVQLAIGLWAKSSTTANMVQLATEATTAHGQLDNLRQQIAVDAPTGNVGGALYAAVNEFKDSMGALGSFTGTPNAETVASFTTQFRTAVSDWNTAVGEVYSGTTSTPPRRSKSADNPAFGSVLGSLVV